jgi:Domain of unknown function (DUF4432)
MNNHLSLPKDRLLEYLGSMDQLAGVRRFQLSEGRAKGVEAIHSYKGDLPEVSSAFVVSDLTEKNFGAELSYPTHALPYLVQWKLCGKGEYVLGIEPGNCLVEGRQWHRQQHLPRLEPGEVRTFNLRLSVLTTAEEVANCIAKYSVN